MKIAYVHHCGLNGGAGNSLYILLSQLKNLNYEIHLVIPRGEIVEKFKKVTHNIYVVEVVPLEFSAEGVGLIRTIYANVKSYLLRNAIQEITEIIGTIKPDIVHLNEIGMFSLAKSLKKRFQIPIVMHARTVPNRKYKYLINRFTNFSNDYIDYLICISKSVYALLPNVKNKIIVYNPVNLSIDEIENNTRINYNSKKLKVLFLANFYRQKGVDEALEAAICLRKNKRIEFVFIGSNTKSDSYFKSIIGRILDIFNFYPNYEVRLESEKVKHKLKNLILKGQIENVHSEIKKCHLLIAPMHLNGTPRSVLEAGVYGIPSILSLHDKIDDLVEDGVNGFVIGEKDIQDLIDKILLLENNRLMLCSMGEAAKFKFKKICDKKLIAKQVSLIYSKCYDIKFPETGI